MHELYQKIPLVTNNEVEMASCIDTAQCPSTPDSEP